MKFFRPLAATVLLISASVLVRTPNAEATTLYQQPAIWTNGASVGSSWTSQLDSTNGGFVAFDDFSLSTTGIINQVSWLGIYLGLPALDDASPNTDVWRLAFYANSANAPGAVLSSTDLAAANITRQSVGTGFFGANQVTVYEFTANVNSFTAVGNTKYFFTALSFATNFSPLFSWIQGSGGDNATFQTHYSNGAPDSDFARPGDRAFTLSNTDVPEPATWVMIGFMLAGLAVARRCGHCVR